MLLLLGILGLIAGALTTVAGMGGGLFLLAVLTVLRGPHLALALTSPALLASNTHRAFLFRREIDRRTTLLIAMGALPGALLGGLVLPAIPEPVVVGLLVVTTVFALLRAKGWVRLRLRSKSLAAAGAGVGALSSTSGGAGLLLGPLLMSAGITGGAFVGTIAACASAMHVGRVIGYIGSGLLTSAVWLPASVLLGGLLVGNLIGRRLRAYMPEGSEPKVELAALVVTSGLAVVQLAR